jgi:hypothetical protein
MTAPDIHKMHELIMALTKLVEDTPPSQFPQVLNYKPAIHSTKYRITVEIVQPDFYVDHNGNKWARVKE